MKKWGNKNITKQLHQTSEQSDCQVSRSAKIETWQGTVTLAGEL